MGATIAGHQPGHLYCWGNDRLRCEHSFENPAVAPQYNFIVMQDMIQSAGEKARDIVWTRRTMTIKSPEAIAARDIRPLRKALFIGVIIVVMAVAAVAGSAWPPESPIRLAIKIIGIALIFVCIVGRTWSRLYVGWHKTRQLVRAGPYSVCRNPLYFFSILGAAGAGAQSGSVAVALLVAVPVWYVLHKVALQEEAALARLHGETFQSYLRDVPQFLPRFSLWRDVALVEVRPGDIVKTLLEGCLFLLAVPAFALVEFYQASGLLPIYYRLF